MRKAWIYLLWNSQRVAHNFVLLALLLGLGVAACLQEVDTPELASVFTFSSDISPEKLITTPVTYLLNNW